MKIKKESCYLRVVGQKTISRKIDLIAEESVNLGLAPYKFIITKGDVIKRVNPKTFALMSSPKTVLINAGKNLDIACLCKSKPDNYYKP